jgi:hypothetical protein
MVATTLNACCWKATNKVGEVPGTRSWFQPQDVLWPRSLDPLTYVAAVGLLVMGAVLIYADIVKPVSIFG